MRTGGTRRSVPGRADPRGQLLDQRRADLPHVRRSPIGRADRSSPLPLSHGQERLWFLHHANSGSPEYSSPLVLRLHGQLDVLAFCSAWTRLLERHEILRTRYTITGAAPNQLIDSPQIPHLRVIDLTELSPPDQDHAERTLAGQLTGTPFDLEHGWPMRARLLALAADEHVLLLASHPIACDAWSLGILLAELCFSYNAFTAGQSASPHPLPTQYADYAAWQRRDLAGAGVQAQLEYWRSKLADQHALQLPTDRPRPAVRDPRGAAVSFTISDDLARGVRQLAGDHDTTQLAVLLTAFQALLARYTSAADISTGISVNVRSHPDLRHLIGDGINTLIVRSRWSGDPTFRAMLAGTRGSLLDAVEQALPFAMVVNELRPERDLSRTPLYQTEFILQDDISAGLRFTGLTVTLEVGHNTAARADLTLDIRAAADGPLIGLLVYATALFDHTTVERMADHYLRLLAVVTANPASSLSSIAILSDTERNRLIGDWHASAQARVTECVHEMFAAQAARTPDVVAVVAGKVRLTSS